MFTRENPPRASEATESADWPTDALGEELWDTCPPVPEDELPPPRPRTRSIAVRFDDSTLQRIKTLAARRHKGYQSLLSFNVSRRRSTAQAGISTGKMLAHSPAAEAHRAGDTRHSLLVA